MPIIARQSSTFKPAPSGLHTAVCCDVVDMGIIESEWQGKRHKRHVCRVVWQLEDYDPETGLRPIVQKRYTLSTHPKSTLRADFESWRGRAFTEDEAQAFDVERVLGVTAQLNIVHKAREGNTYANVVAVLPGPKGVRLTVDGYTRVCDRVPEPGATGHTSDDDSGDPEVEEVPF